MNHRIAYLAGGVALAGSLAWGIARMDRQPSDPAAQAADTLQTAHLQAAATQPVGATNGPSKSALLPAEFAILQTRNAFAHGRGRGGGLEASLVFKGAVQVGSDFTAFFEDVASKNVVRAKVGDAVARGRIKSIDLDAIEYAVADNARRIEVGQDLNGKAAPPPATRPSAPTPKTPPAGMPTGPGGRPPNLPPGVVMQGVQMGPGPQGTPPETPPQ